MVENVEARNYSLYTIIKELLASNQMQEQSINGLMARISHAQQPPTQPDDSSNIFNAFSGHAYRR